MKKLIVLFLLSGAFVSAQAQTVDFKLNLPLNKPEKMLTIMKMDMEGQQSIIMDMTSTSSMNITKFEQGNYTMEIISEKMKMDMDAGMMTISYDSENPSDEPMSQMLATEMDKLVGKKTTIVMDERGKIISTESEIVDENNQNPLQNMSMTATYPDKPVKPGDTWESQATNKGVTTKAVNKFVEKTDQGYILESIAEMFDDEGKSIGDLTTTYTVDPKTFSTTHAIVKATMDIAGQKIVMDMQSDILKN